MSTAKKISWITTSLLFAGAGLVFAGGAFAQNPKPADRMTREQRDALQDQQHADFERARREVKRRMVPVTPPAQAAAPKPVTTDVRVTVEQVEDGLVVVSMPYDPQLEQYLTQSYKVAKSREEAFDNALFGGRLYRQIPLAPTADEQRFLRLVGKEVIVSMTAKTERVMIVDARPPR